MYTYNNDTMQIEGILPVVYSSSKPNGDVFHDYIIDNYYRIYKKDDFDTLEEYFNKDI